MSTAYPAREYEVETLRKLIEDARARMETARAYRDNTKGIARSAEIQYDRELTAFNALVKAEDLIDHADKWIESVES